MTARWMQQKIVKRKRMKRLAPKWYPSTHDGRKALAYDDYNNSGTADVRSTKGPRNDAEPSFNNTWVDSTSGKVQIREVPVTRPLNKKGERVPSPRLEVEIQAYQIRQSQRTQSIQTFHVGAVLRDHKGVTVRVYFSGNTYCLVSDDGKRRKRTAFYNDRHLLYRMFELDQLCWFPIDKHGVASK